MGGNFAPIKKCPEPCDFLESCTNPALPAGRFALQNGGIRTRLDIEFRGLSNQGFFDAHYPHDDSLQGGFPSVVKRESPRTWKTTSRT